MDKNKAAHDYVAFKELNNDPPYIALYAFLAGCDWQAAQCLGDAVEFAEWIKENGFEYNHDGNWHRPSQSHPWFTTAKLYKLFNHSGAAPQANPVLEKLEQMSTNSSERLAVHARNHHLREALQAYVGAQGRMLDKWADGDESVKQGLWKALHACEEKGRVALDELPVPAAAGPVWVKASERVPNHYMNVHIRYKTLHFGATVNASSTVRYNDSANEWLTQNGCHLEGYTNLEWLDESAPQVFTRERVETMLIDLARDIRSDKVTTIADVVGWFEINYPAK